MNNLIVYCEIEDGIIADVSLELLTKGRSLANQLNCKLEALVIGSNLDGVEKQVFPYGVDTVYTVDDPRLYPYTSLPHTSVLVNLFKDQYRSRPRSEGFLFAAQRTHGRLHRIGNRSPRGQKEQ